MDEFDRAFVARAEGWRRDIAGDDPEKMDEFDLEFVARAEGWRRDIAGDDPVKKEVSTAKVPAWNRYSEEGEKLYRFVGLVQMGAAMMVLNRIGDNDGTGTAGALIAWWVVRAVKAVCGNPPATWTDTLVELNRAMVPL